MTVRPPSRDPRLLRGLQYFEAVARLGSVSLAADEIGISASAISHQLRELAGALGEDLVTRQGRGIVLTEVGQRVASQLTEVFGGVDGIFAIIVGGQRKSLRLAVCSSFGPAWLAPRLPQFARLYPDVDLELRLYAQDPEQTLAIADAMVTAQPIRAGYSAVPLFEEMLVAVQRPRRDDEPDAEKLITTDTEEPDLGRDWHRYLELTGRPASGADSTKMIRCTHYLLAIELAKAGIGTALVPDFLAAGALANGSLIRLDGPAMPSKRRYALCYKSARAGDPTLRSLALWLTGETHRKPRNVGQIGFEAAKPARRIAE